MPRLRYFAQAREAAGTAAEVVAGTTVAEVLAAAVARHGERLAAVLGTAAVWVDGEPADPADPVADSAELAVLPPVSGGVCGIGEVPAASEGRLGILGRMAEPDALADDLLDGLADLPIEEVRARRAACQQLETQLSYVRRLAQGRLDIVASEVTARRDGTSGTRTLVEQLTEALSDRLTAPGNGHLPMVLAPGDVDPELLASLDRAAPPAQVTSPASMDDDELREVAEALARLERELSTRRRAMFDRIDAFQAEIVRRYRSGEADVDSLLGR